jgi:hypothetical protein
MVMAYRELETMSVDGHVPAPGEVLERSHMVEVAMGHDNRRRPSVLAEAALGCVHDVICGRGELRP